MITAGLSTELPGDFGPRWMTASGGQGVRAAPAATANGLCGRDLCSHVSGCSEEQWPWRAVLSLGTPSSTKTLSRMSLLLLPVPAVGAKILPITSSRVFFFLFMDFFSRFIIYFIILEISISFSFHIK